MEAVSGFALHNLPPPVIHSSRKVLLSGCKIISPQFRQCGPGSFEPSGEPRSRGLPRSGVGLALTPGYAGEQCVCQPRSRGLPRSGVGLALTPGYAGEQCVSQPRSRGFSLFGLSRANPRQFSQLKLNCENPRERG